MGFINVARMDLTHTSLPVPGLHSVSPYKLAKYNSTRKTDLLKYLVNSSKSMLIFELIFSVRVS